VIPLEVSQSHSSVPSRSMASTWNPPPGITTTAAPVFLPWGAYTVSVGCVTLVTEVTGFPANSSLPTVAVSGPGTDCLPGGLPGQIGIWTCPPDGSQAVACAFAALDAHSRHSARMGHGFMGIPRLGSRARPTGGISSQPH